MKFQTPTIQTKHLNVFYEKKHAVKDVSLSFSNFEVAALIGPSGCGKSSYLRCLNRMNDFILKSKITGEVLLEGQDIYSPEVDPVLVRRHIGMVFQKANPFPKSIYENIAWGLRRAKINLDKIDESVEHSLKRAGLWSEVKDRLRTPAMALSGGQQQRLCIARAIAMGPRVLLMDEPCSALDPIATARIEELISELKTDYCIVIVTHNMQQALRVSDRTAFFMDGRVVEWDRTESLFHSPSIPETRNYLTGQFG